MKSILICKTNTGCYQSMNFFADMAKQALTECGYQVQEFDWEKEKEAGISKIIGKPFEAILDFNSKIPKMTYQGRILLDELNAPFYDWLLDHPIYHHDYLKQIEKKHDVHVICLDQNHASYIKRWYPDIKSVQMLPLAGVERKTQTLWEERAKDVLFCATYVNPEVVLKEIEHSPEELKESSLWMITYLQQHTGSTLEEAGEEYRKYNPYSIMSAISFPTFLQIHFMVDTYIKAYYREKILSVLIKEKVPLSIYGANWQSFFEKNTSVSLKIHDQISYEKTLEIQAEHDIVLNVMPWFKAGAHDRIFTTMGCQSVCFTDSTIYVEQNYAKDSYVSFSIDEIEAIPEKVFKLFENERLMKQIAASGKRETEQLHMWKNRMQSLFG